MSEENVAPAEMPTAAATPAAPGTNPTDANSTEANPAGAAAPEWQQVPAGETASDANPTGGYSANGGDADSDAPRTDATATDSSIAPATTPALIPAAIPATIPVGSASSATTTVAPPAAASSTLSPTDSPAATQTAPALNLDTVGSTASLSDAALDAEIAKAGTPALAASLRITEEARQRLAADQTDEAIRLLSRAVSIDPGNPFEYFHLGRGYIAKKNYAQALTFLKRAEIGFRARPDWLGETASLEGACYEELGQLPDAQRAYQRALAEAPNNLMARVGYGRLAASAGPPAALDAPAPAAHDAIAPPADSSTQAAPNEAPPAPAPAEYPPRTATDTSQPASD